jgi:methionyl-tRNA formyltransferase
VSSLPRVVFAGTPNFAVPTLLALSSAPVELAGVFTQPDRPAGRGKALTPSPVKEAALAQGLSVYQPERIRDDVPVLTALRPDLLVVVAYGQILSQAILDVPAVDVVNVHASLLPRWRGAAPIQRAIEAGDAQSGVAIMRVVRELDAGPVFLMRSTPIRATDTSLTLHDRLATLGAEALMEALPGILNGTLAPVEQAADAVTYASRIDKAQARIDWRAPAAEIERRVRAFAGWPVCETMLGDKRVRIWASRVVAQPASGASTGAEPGTVIAANAAGVDVATGAGVLRLTELQLPGRKPLSAEAFLNATALTGARFS